MAINFEQFINAWYLRELGYGNFSVSFQPTLAMFTDFESHLDDYRRNIRETFVDGTEIVTNRVRDLICNPAPQKDR